MSYRSGVVSGVILTLLLAGGGYLGWHLLNTKATAAQKSAPPPIPAVINNPLKEELINTITLTNEAESRLALTTAPVERKPMRRTRTYGGEVTIPVGQSVIVSAPLGGLLRATSTGIPLPGQLVKQGQPMFELLALLTPEGRANLATAKVDADGQVKNAETQLEAMTIALNRANQLFKNDAGSKRQVDEAQAQVDLARKSLEAVTARRNLLSNVIGEIDKGTAAPIVIDAPVAGVLRNINVRPGQNIPAGAPLFELFDPATVWIRVPVYVGDLKDLDVTANARITMFTAAAGAPGQSARPVMAPPSANAAAGTVDLFYELDNRTSKYSPAHRVGVTLQQIDTADSLTLPWSAVVHDIHGGTWVYELTSPHTYIRRRVVVKFVHDATAVLASGPPAGKQVVNAGAAELFGAESGFSK